MVWRSDCADPETGTMTVDKLSLVSTMTHKCSEWRLEASLMGLDLNQNLVDPSGSNMRNLEVLCQFLKWHSVDLIISKCARI